MKDRIQAFSKKPLSLFLALIMIITILPYNAITAEAANRNDVVDKLMSIATSEKIGYYSDDNKYTHWYGKIGGSYKYYWCATFVSWCINQAGILTKVVPKTAGCSPMADALNKQGVLYSPSNYTPQKGDIVFFTNGKSKYSHVGFILEYNSKTKKIRTVEGNTGWGNYLSSCVNIKWRDPNYKAFKVSAYAHPNYGSSHVSSFI